MFNKYIYKKLISKLVSSQNSPFHVVPKSPWPILTSISIFVMLIGIVLDVNYFSPMFHTLMFGLYSLIFFLTRWFLDVILESLKGNHTSYVANGLRLGFILLIVSEIMFFFSFFWGYFHITFSLSVHTGVIWPYVKGPYPWALPFLNTMLLGLSSLTLTEAHIFFLKKKKLLTIFFLFLTIFLGSFFTVIQGLEYLDSPLTFNNGTCGSIFYMLTGFHGFHVLIGTIFLIITLIRIVLDHFLLERHIFLEVSSLYWHFVDIVWFFLFFFVYIWGDF